MIVSFYDPNTGIFTGKTFDGSWRALKLNTPRGQKYLQGRYDHRSQRVDLQTDEVVAYVPAPDPDAERRERRRKARRRIAWLESQQLRPMRELALDPTNEDVRARLEAIEAEIAALRAELDPRTKKGRH